MTLTRRWIRNRPIRDEAHDGAIGEAKQANDGDSARKRKSSTPIIERNQVPRLRLDYLFLCLMSMCFIIITSQIGSNQFRDDDDGGGDDQNRNNEQQQQQRHEAGAGIPLGKLVQFDDDDDDDTGGLSHAIQDEDEYLEDDEFYSQHPVDKLATDDDDDDLGLDIKVNDTDFDDHEVFKTSEFYSPSAPSSAKRRRRRRRPRQPHRLRLPTATISSSGRLKSLRVKQPPVKATSTTRNDSRRLTAVGDESRREQLSAGPATAAAGCALWLMRGDCISLESVEWAIRRAKRLIDYSRPAGLMAAGQASESSINAVGQLNEMTTRLLAGRYRLTPDEINFELEALDVRRTSLWAECPRQFRRPPRCSPAQLAGRYRSHSGRCNNLLRPHLGSAGMPFARLLPPDYGDSVGAPRGSLPGLAAPAAGPNRLPPARLVAIRLHSLAGQQQQQSLEVFSSDLSALFMSWGQLINHDLAQASTGHALNGHGHKCCGAAGSSSSGANRLTDNCMPIQLAPDDPVYGPHKVRCHDFKRSLAGLRPGCSLGPRTQINTISAHVDASFVYGSSRATSDSLRANARGQLSMWAYFGAASKPLLPGQRDSPDTECIGRPAGLYCFRSGDSRTNQQIQLVVLHTIHARQHNRLALGLAALNPHWSSRRIYQEARHIHIALIQHILLSEYLPLLLGRHQCEQYNLTETPPPPPPSPLISDDDLHSSYWFGYEPLNPHAQATISQEFAAAAFRQGHTSVPSRVFRFDPIRREPTRVYLLRELFRRPWPLFEAPHAMDEFLAGLLEVPAKQPDQFMSPELSGHLLQVPDEPVGLDLASINIQRGRDQALASYSSARDWCGLTRADSFEQLHELAIMSQSSAIALSELFASVHDLDLFTGGASEFPLDGAQVGPTFACIIGRQFKQLRSADRFWFESPLGAHAFTPGQLNSIKRVSLARLMCVNSDSGLAVQLEALRLAHPILNARQPCDSLADLDLSLWLDAAAAAADNYDNDASDDDNDDDDDADED